MGLRISRVCVALALMVSGGLMYAASRQRWSGACPWGSDPDTRACDLRMDHLYDFLPPAEPWEPAGMSPELAGASLLVFAVALVALPWALASRAGAGTVLALSVCVLVVIDVAVAVLRSGLADTVVRPVLDDLTRQGTVAARLLKRAAVDAREHVPLHPAINTTALEGIH